MTIFDYALSRQRAKIVKGYRLSMYYQQLYNIAIATFEYNGLPESLPSEWIEAILISNGTVGIGEIDNTLYCCAGGYTGALNGYVPSRYIGAVPAIGTVEGDAKSPANYKIIGEAGKTIVVGWNNPAMLPEFDMFDTAEALTEARTSEDINVIFSRLLRLPIAKSQKDKTAIESAIKAILDGKIEAIASEFKGDILNPDKNLLEFVDLVDIKDVDKLQYLNQYHDNVLKRYMRNHGISLNITNKLAQQTNAEMHGADDYSLIYPLLQLKYRRRMIDDLNRIFGNKYGFNASVDFSEMFKNSYDKAVNFVPDELNEKEVVGNDETGDSQRGGSGSDDDTTPV